MMLPTLLMAVTLSTVSIEESPSAAAVEQVEIMRVVLTRELGRALSSDGSGGVGRTDRQESSFFRGRQDRGDQSDPDVATSDPLLVAESLYGSLASSRSATSHTRGFVAPGIGAWFSTEVRVPVRPNRAESESAPAPDAWEDAAAEVRTGGQNTARGRVTSLYYSDQSEVTFALDRSSIDKVTEAAWAILADHGHRLTEIADVENLVVAVRFVANGAVVSNSDTVVTDFAGSNRVGFGFVRSEASSETVVIRVPVRAARALHEGRLGRDELRRQTSITRYGVAESARVTGGVERGR